MYFSRITLNWSAGTANDDVPVACWDVCDDVKAKLEMSKLGGMAAVFFGVEFWQTIATEVVICSVTIDDGMN